jgi:hypothetical protein
MLGRRWGESKANRVFGVLYGGMGVVWWFLGSLFSKFASCFIPGYICVCFSFSNGDVMRGVFYWIYHVGYEEFVGVVVSGGWISSVV